MLSLNFVWCEVDRWKCATLFLNIECIWALA